MKTCNSHHTDDGPCPNVGQGHFTWTLLTSFCLLLLFFSRFIKEVKTTQLMCKSNQYKKFVKFLIFTFILVRSGSKQLASIINFLLSIVATFAFGVIASQYAFSSMAVVGNRAVFS